MVVIVTCSLVCLALILLCSGDVERNPGPGWPKQACPQCLCMVHTRKLVCECGFSFNQSLIYKAFYLNQR